MTRRDKIIIGSIISLGVTGTVIYLNKKSSPALDLVSQKIMDRFAKSNLNFLSQLNPEAKGTFKSFLNDIVKKGYAVVITSSYRSVKDQAVQKKANKKNATPGYSTHDYGIALDINLVKDGKWINKDSTPALWKSTGIVDLAKKKYKMRWGGDFPNYADTVHFDLGNKYNVVTLYAKALKQYGTPDNIKGNQMRLAA